MKQLISFVDLAFVIVGVLLIAAGAVILPCMDELFRWSLPTITAGGTAIAIGSRKI